MKIKMVDVAKRLGISKATVSLAVNGKPGVNEQTRQKVLECIKELEKNNGVFPEPLNSPEKEAHRRMIKVLIINHRRRVVCDPELDL